MLINIINLQQFSSSFSPQRPLCLLPIIPLIPQLRINRRIQPLVHNLHNPQRRRRQKSRQQHFHQKFRGGQEGNVEVGIKEDHRGDIHTEGNNDRENHPFVPSMDNDTLGGGEVREHKKLSFKREVKEKVIPTFASSVQIREVNVIETM